MRLDPRLSLVARMVPAGLGVADVGSDHGHLAAALAADGTGRPTVWATDVHVGPARQLEQRFSGLDGVTVGEGDGLHALPINALGADRVAVVALAGMGGHRMRKILSGAPVRLSRLSRVVAQPNSDLPALVAALRDLGWREVDGAWVAVGGRRYPVVALEPGEADQPVGAAAWVGTTAARSRDPVARAYLEHRRDELEAVVAKGGGAARHRGPELAALHAALAAW